jgi:hypothetical protein
MHWVYTPGQGVYTQNIPEIVLLQTHYSEIEQYILQIYTTNILFPETHILLPNCMLYHPIYCFI